MAILAVTTCDRGQARTEAAGECDPEISVRRAAPFHDGEAILLGQPNCGVCSVSGQSCRVWCLTEDNQLSNIRECFSGAQIWQR